MITEGQHLARNNQNCLTEHLELCITDFPEENSVLIVGIALLPGMLERPLLCFYYFIQKRVFLVLLNWKLRFVKGMSLL